MATMMEGESSSIRHLHLGGPPAEGPAFHLRRLGPANPNSTTAATTTAVAQLSHPSKGGWYILAFVVVVVVLAAGLGVACCFCEGCGCHTWLKRQRRRRRRRRSRRRRQQDRGGGENGGASDADGDDTDDDTDDTDDDDECCVLTIVNRNHPAWRGGRNHRNGTTVLHPSDVRYRQRQQRERERRRGTPAQRKRKILQSFVRCQVVKVVQAEDLIPAEDATAPREATRRDDKENIGKDGLAPSLADPAKAATSASSGTLDEGQRLDGPDAATAEDRCETGQSSTSRPDGEEEALAVENVVHVDATTANIETGQTGGTGDDALEESTGDEVGDAEDEEEEDEVDDSNGYLQLTPRRRVPNCCAVCLSGYAVGDKVVWSHNRKCRHAFHRDCIVNWFVKMPDDAGASAASGAATTNNRRTASSSSSSPPISTPCPCCRRDFTDLEEYRRQRRIRWGAEYAFNPRFITFR